jgi:hypothetical protein
MSTIPRAPAPETTEQRFERLADRWEKETAFLSSTTEEVAHPAFQEIVRMGEAVIPLVLQRMARGTGHWDLAMSRITGERPWPPSAAGKIPVIEQAWFDWARQKGYVW